MNGQKGYQTTFNGPRGLALAKDEQWLFVADSYNNVVRGVRTYTFDAPARVTLLTERRRNQPYGLQGGQPGQVGSNRLIRADGDVTCLPPKVSFDVFPGDSLQLCTPGGGGWGKREEP